MIGFWLGLLVTQFLAPTLSSPLGPWSLVRGFTLNEEGEVYFYKPVMGVHHVREILEVRLRGSSPKQRRGLAQHLVDECSRHGFDPAFVLSVMQAESGFRVQAVSPVGAMGLMQVMPATAQYISHKWGLKYSGPRDLFNPKANLSLGVQYLAFLRDKYAGDFEKFMAAYNMGPGRVDQLVQEGRFVLRGARPYVEAIHQGTLEFRSSSQRLAHLSLQ